jgi:hypothetical protein
MNQATLNRVYSKLTARRRYEVWFLRIGLADGSGAWWFRYLLFNLGRHGCPGNPQGMPVQIWATWFPRGGEPQKFIRGFPVDRLSVSPRGRGPFHFAHGENRMSENSCTGQLSVDGHYLRWDLRYRSTLAITLSDRHWIGFSRTPHSDAVFSGDIMFDGRAFRGDPLGFGLQGHNCGHRHRRMWTWAHGVFREGNGDGLSVFEALEYEMPWGARYRRAMLRTSGNLYWFSKFEKVERDWERLRWAFECRNRREGGHLEVTVDGSGPCLHRLPYLKTDCSETMVVSNNSLANATLRFHRSGGDELVLTTADGAVLEMAGE